MFWVYYSPVCYVTAVNEQRKLLLSAVYYLLCQQEFNKGLCLPGQHLDSAQCYCALETSQCNFSLRNPTWPDLNLLLCLNWFDLIFFFFFLARGCKTCHKLEHQKTLPNLCDSYFYWKCWHPFLAWHQQKCCILRTLNNYSAFGGYYFIPFKFFFFFFFAQI